MKYQPSLPFDRIENIEDALWLAANIATANRIDSHKFAEKRQVDLADVEEEQMGSAKLDINFTQFGSLDRGRSIDETNLSLIENKQTENHFDAFPVSITKSSKRIHTSFLNIQRALRPLKIQYPNYSLPKEIDIEATLYRFAEDQLRSYQQESPSLPELRVALPIMQPSVERWLDVVVIVDQWSTMRFYEEKVQLFSRAIEQSGIFRRIYKYNLNWKTKENHPELSYAEGLRKNFPVNPKSLINENSARVILFISDCMSPLWGTWIGENGIGQIIRDLGSHHPVAILQTLPDDLWLRTGLAYCTFGEVTSTKMACPNTHLNSTPRLPSDPDLPVPVLTFEVESILAWARLITGKADTSVSAAYIPTKIAMEVDFVEDYGKTVDTFLATAPTQAQHLAACLAVVTGISIDQFHQFQTYCISDTESETLGKLITGGIIQVIHDEIGIPSYLDEFRPTLADSISNIKKLETMRYFYENCLEYKFTDGENTIDDFWFFFDNRNLRFHKPHYKLEQFEETVLRIFPLPPESKTPSRPSPLVSHSDNIISEANISSIDSTIAALEQMQNPILEPLQPAVSVGLEREEDVVGSESTFDESEDGFNPIYGELIRQVDVDYLNLPVIHVSMWGGASVGKTSLILSLTRDNLLHSQNVKLARLGHYGNVIDITYKRPNVNHTEILKDFLFLHVNEKSNASTLVCYHDFPGQETLELSEKVKISYEQSDALFLCIPANQAEKYRSELFTLLHFIQGRKSLRLGICFTKSDSILSFPDSNHYLPNVFGPEVMKILGTFPIQTFWISSHGKSSTDWVPDKTSMHLAWLLDKPTRS